MRPQSVVVKAPSAQASDGFGVDEDDWAVVNFAPEKKASEEPIDEDRWSMGAPSSMPTPVQSKEDDWKVMSRSIDDDFFSDDEVTPEEAEAPTHEDGAPLASHTLVDLYVAQNHIGPAIDLLENIIALNPQDYRSVARLRELKAQPTTTTETDGHDELMRIIETEVQAPQAVKMERALKLFLQQIQLTADEKRNPHYG